MSYLNGYDSDQNLSGFGSRLKKKLKRLKKNKLFKAAVIVGAGAFAASYAGPMIKSKAAGALKYKGAAKKLLSKGRKAIRAKAKESIGLQQPQVSPQPSELELMRDELRKAKTLLKDQREQYLLSSDKMRRAATGNAQANIQPILEQGYIDEGYSPESAYEMANHDSGVIAEETAENFKQKTGKGSAVLPIIGIGALLTMLG